MREGFWIPFPRLRLAEDDTVMNRTYARVALIFIMTLTPALVRTKMAESA